MSIVCLLLLRVLINIFFSSGQEQGILRADTVLRLLLESTFFLILGFLEHAILNRRIQAIHLHVFLLFHTHGNSFTLWYQPLLFSEMLYSGCQVEERVNIENVSKKEQEGVVKYKIFIQGSIKTFKNTSGKVGNKAFLLCGQAQHNCGRRWVCIKEGNLERNVNALSLNMKHLSHYLKKKD